RARPNSFSITGGSGVGKSSFLRAGIVGRLRHGELGGAYTDCIVRPTELLPRDVLAHLEEGESMETGIALQRLLERAAERIAATAQADAPTRDTALKATSAFPSVAAGKQPAWVVAQLTEILARLGPVHRLVIG